MPKKQIFADDQPAESIVLENLMKKLLTQQKPKQKRTISEERKEQLRQQLVKGRQNSITARSKAKVEKEVKPQTMEVEITPVPPNTPTDSKQFNNLHTKIDDLVTHMKEVASLQKETLEYKKNKRKNEKVHDPDDDFLIFKKKEVKEEPKQTKPSEPIKPAPQPAPIPAPAKPVPSYYYAPIPKKTSLF